MYSSLVRQWFFVSVCYVWLQVNYSDWRVLVLNGLMWSLSEKPPHLLLLLCFQAKISLTTWLWSKVTRFCESSPSSVSKVLSKKYTFALCKYTCTENCTLKMPGSGDSQSLIHSEEPINLFRCKFTHKCNTLSWLQLKSIVVQTPASH